MKMTPAEEIRITSRYAFYVLAVMAANSVSGDWIRFAGILIAFLLWGRRIKIW